MLETKTCGRCKADKPMDEFWNHVTRGKQHYCKECGKQQNRAYRDKHPTYARDWYGLNRVTEALKQRLRKYGLTEEQFLDMWLTQLGACAICEEALEDGCIDHCHKTGRVRGLLCRRCNSTLGWMEEDPERIRAMVNYVETRCK